MRGKENEPIVLSSGEGNNQRGGNSFFDTTYIRSIEGILRITALVSVGTYIAMFVQTGRLLATFHISVSNFIEAQ